MVPAKKIMTKDVIVVHPQTPIYEAMSRLTGNAISGLPVVDDAGRLVGMITEKDVLRILINANIGAQDKVQDFMTRDVISFEEDASATTICEFFMKNPIRRVPITKDGKLTGIVSRRDIIGLILESRNKLSRF